MRAQSNAVRTAFPKPVLDRIMARIAEVETATNAEFRISVRDLREASEADLSLRELAIREFGLLKMHETEGRRGILLLILFSERKFYIFGDEGVSKHIAPEKWKDVATALSTNFRDGAYERGVLEALGLVEQHLKGILPPRSSSTNELSDEVVIR